MLEHDFVSYNKLVQMLSFRIGTEKVMQLVVSVKTQVSINPREHKLIWVCIDKNTCEGLSIENLKQDPWICHSEDFDDLVMDEKNLHVWYTLIELDEDLSFEVLYNNCSDQHLDFYPGEEPRI